MLHKSSFQRFLRFRRIRVPCIDVTACNLAHLRRQFRRCGRLRAAQNAVEGRVHQHLGALLLAVYDMALTFKYDHNGLRTQKIVEASWYPETTNYYLHGKLLTHMTVDYRDSSEVAHQDVLHFFYDAQSRPANHD